MNGTIWVKHNDMLAVKVKVTLERNCHCNLPREVTKQGFNCHDILPENKVKQQRSDKNLGRQENPGLSFIPCVRTNIAKHVNGNNRIVRFLVPRHVQRRFFRGLWVMEFLPYFESEL